MAVNGVLEGFLTVYGWQVYGSLFLLLVAVGAVIYPVARIVFDAAIHFGESAGSPATGASFLLIRLTIYALVLILGLIPMAPVSVSSTSVHNKCGQEALALAGQEFESLQGADYGFGEISDAQAPLLAYLAMALASGFNAVIYEAIPCLHDLTGLNFAMNTLDFSEAEDPNALRNTVARFERECWRSAQSIYNSFMNGQFGAEGRTFMEERMAAFADDEDERKAQLAYMGSDFYINVFYQACPGGADPLTPGGQLCNMLPLRAREPVPGFPYDPARDSDASQYQIATGQGFPSCSEWWLDAGAGLRRQLAVAGDESLQKNVRKLNSGFCENALAGAALELCLRGLKNQIENSEEVIVQQLLLSGQRNLLSNGTLPELGIGSGLLAGALFIFSDVAGNIASNAAGYLVTIYMLKIGAQLLHPFLLMTVFILWGVFLIIGEMRGMTLVKGMMLLFVLSIIPSLWSLADYIDDQLFLALYPGAPTFSLSNIPAELMSDHSTIERVLLTFTTMVFYVVFPLLMLYLVAEAGGPSNASTITNQGMNRPAHEQGGVAGAGVSNLKGRNPFKKK
ncbi:MAG: conjugal transfer protein TraG N-terminal domain-containing protein [Candidatus Competibacteraceae bacterium]|nr:conjugal transfer protein TraG N-terminal domain-containing protein [Candidatus Competibacteraceae bacterium]